MPQEWTRLTVCLTPEEYQAFRVYSANNAMNMSAMARMLIVDTMHCAEIEKGLDNQSIVAKSS